MRLKVVHLKDAREIASLSPILPEKIRDGIPAEARAAGLQGRQITQRKCVYARVRLAASGIQIMTLKFMCMTAGTMGKNALNAEVQREVLEYGRLICSEGKTEAVNGKIQCSRRWQTQKSPINKHLLQNGESESVSCLPDPMSKDTAWCGNRRALRRLSIPAPLLC